MNIETIKSVYFVGAGGIVATVVEHADDYAVLDGNATRRHALTVLLLH